MAGNPPPLSYWDYVRAAFHQKAHVPGLGLMPVNKMALATFGVLGILNPGFWLLGLAAEVGYLIFVSGNPNYQKVVQGQQLQAQKRGSDERMQKALVQLKGPSQKRYAALLEQCKWVLTLTARLDPEDVQGVKKLRAGSLNQLLWIFVRLLSSREAIVENLDNINRKGLENELKNVEAQLAGAAEGSALRRALEGSLEIQKKRLENFDRAQESLQVLEAELLRIEQQVALIREEAAVGGKAEVLSDRLDSVSSTLSETNRFMEQHAAIFGELGADPLGAAPSDLPEVPEVFETEGSRRT